MKYYISHKSHGSSQSNLRRWLCLVFYELTETTGCGRRNASDDQLPAVLLHVSVCETLYKDIRVCLPFVVGDGGTQMV